MVSYINHGGFTLSQSQEITAHTYSREGICCCIHYPQAVVFQALETLGLSLLLSFLLSQVPLHFSATCNSEVQL